MYKELLLQGISFQNLEGMRLEFGFLNILFILMYNITIIAGDFVSKL